MSCTPKFERRMHYHPRDGVLPELGSLIKVHHAHFDILGIPGIVEGIEENDETGRTKIWLREGDDQPYKYDLLSVSWEYA